jgi:transcriptional regulator
VIFHEYYADVPAADVTRFVEAQALGRLVTVGPDGTPHLGLYPFVHEPGAFELHLVRVDELVTDLESRPRCVFEVDEVLGVIPSYWVSQEYAGSATAYHRTVIFECEATVIKDPAAVAAQQIRLLARYQPEGGFRAVTAADPLYRAALEQLVALRLTVERTRVKFKLAQNPRRKPGAASWMHCARGRPGDAQAADASSGRCGPARLPRAGLREPDPRKIGA